MGQVDALFRERIGLPQAEPISFHQLDTVLERAGRTIPFENLRVIARQTVPINAANLIQKILVQREGGLCYELNALLYLFLLENGFDATLMRAVVFNSMTQQWNASGRTHVTVLVTQPGMRYLVDTGFAGSLPLTPVPLSGEVVTSQSGQFRVDRADGEPGDYVLRRKLHHRDQDWQLGYAFYWHESFQSLSELDAVQEVVAKHPASSFNKRPLLTRRTVGGSMVLTDTSFTQWTDGVMEKRELDGPDFQTLAKEHFGIAH